MPVPVLLVVEDEPLLRMMAVDMAEDAGFEVVEACNADAAVAILETRTDIRLVFTDIDMPGGMDGMRLAACIRDRWPPIEIILTSGKAKPKTDTLPTRSIFFPKPYRHAEIVAAMKRMAPAA
ncbi:MAG: response regulator [Sphingomonas sp.]|jgi:CheY-like chemotaxis protein|nr:MAG: response regulator [Sphingomonas sp.]